MRISLKPASLTLCLAGGLLSAVVAVSSQTRTFPVEDWEKGINERQPPLQIIDAIGLKPGMVVGEVGAGTGRMTMWLADRAGDSGRIYANDISKEHLDHLRMRSLQSGFLNIEFILGEVDNPRLPAGAPDMAFMINVYHHLDNPVPLIQNILPSLKPGATLVIIECDPEKVDWGKEEGCTSPGDMARELRAAGFELVRVSKFLNEDNIYIAKPRSGS